MNGAARLLHQLWKLRDTLAREWREPRRHELSDQERQALLLQLSLRVDDLAALMKRLDEEPAPSGANKDMRGGPPTSVR